MAIQIPSTAAVNSAGLVIQVAAQAIGAITSWDTKQSRDAKPLYEFGSVTTGGGDDIQGDSSEPFELMPQNIGGTDITINRWDLYTNRFETAFANAGIADMTMLTNQTSAIRLVEFWNASKDSLSFKRVYYGFFFTSLGRTYNAEGGREVSVSSGGRYTRSRTIE